MSIIKINVQVTIIHFQKKRIFELIKFGLIVSIVLLLSLGFVSCTKEDVSSREELKFTTNWKFYLGDSAVFKNPDFYDKDWRKLTLPHDWSIEGKFEVNNPAGIGGGALPGGIGWYRKTFYLPEADSGKKIFITFDGVYQNSEVYINGEFLGRRPNGYITFQYDLTPYLLFGESKNVIAVKVDNSDQPNSRWYSGSGIYRNVWLKKAHPIHIPQWGSHITTPKVSEESADVHISITVKNTTSKSEKLIIETNILDEDNNIVSRKTSNIVLNENNVQELTQNMTVLSPKLWSIDNPYLYKAISKVKLNKHVIDTYETTFGIRYFKFDSQKGFSLNGKPTKILGVCNHHDLGALGAAFNTRARERQLEILKEMGCNGIRTSHNPPSPEFLELCDRMGFIVMNETFDMWKKRKTENDYSKYWDEWHVKDLTDHLLRDRNHPCIFSWSIGNEILEQWDTSGVTISKELAAIVKEYAPNIPVTSACNDPEPHNNIIKSGVLDLIGFNYHHETFEDFQKKFPGQKFIATETTSSLNSRGVYNMPYDSVRKWPKRWDIPFYEGNPDNTCSSYDNCHAPWGSTHEATWKLIKKHDYLSGFYIWTGFDYLGEPTPYQWPSRSSYFGIIDLAGFPKDVYYMYQSEWTDKNVLHVFPHWNWEAEQTVDVVAYTNFDEVELFINGKSQGTKSKMNDDVSIHWSVKYEPGVLKAIGKRADGQEKEVEILTAGKPAKIILKADRKIIKADGNDLSFVTVLVTDENDILVPDASNLIEFDVSENLGIAGVSNGNQTSHEPFQSKTRKVFNGKCMVILRAGEASGEAYINAYSKGLLSASMELKLE